MFKRLTTKVFSVVWVANLFSCNCYSIKVPKSRKRGPRGFTVLCFFSNGMSVNLILMCGIAVSSSPAACSFLCFWLTSLRKHPFVLALRRWGLQVSGESQTSCARLVSSIIRTLTRRAQLVCDSPDSLQDETDYLKPGFHMIVPIVPVVSKNVQTIGTIIWKRYPDDRKRPGRLRRPRSLG